MLVPLEPDYMLVLGECGGRLLYHEPAPTCRGSTTCCLSRDKSALSVTTQMWGAMSCSRRAGSRSGSTSRHAYTPVGKEFTFAYFTRLVDELVEGEKRSVKGCSRRSS